jgi:hypothetical protein
VRYAVFDTDNYGARVYAFENDLFSAFSIPAYAGKGTRFYINLNWRISRRFKLEARIDQTWQEQAVSGGGTAGVKTGVNLQMRVGL